MYNIRYVVLSIGALFINTFLGCKFYCNIVLPPFKKVLIKGQIISLHVYNLTILLLKLEIISINWCRTLHSPIFFLM